MAYHSEKDSWRAHWTAWLSSAAPFALALALWWVLSLCGGLSRLLPSPPEVLAALWTLCRSADAWRDMAVSLGRGCAGLLLAGLAAFAGGIACGRHPRFLSALSPLILFGQGCPPVVWISLLLVWCALGHAVPVLVVFISVFPPLFLNVAGSTAALDERYFELARLYRVPMASRLKSLVLPGIMPTVAPAVSYSIGIAWKVTATAEFFGATDGVGARVHESFRLLELPGLFAWSLLLALMGVLVNVALGRLRASVGKPREPQEERR